MSQKSSYGVHTRRMNAGAFTVTETMHRAGQRTGRHDHAWGCVHVVLRGVYVEITPGHALVLPPGSALSKPPDVQHWNLLGSRDTHTLRIEVAPSHWNGLGFEADAVGVVPYSSEVLRLATTMKKLIQDEARGSVSALASCVRQLLAAMSDEKSDASDSIGLAAGVLSKGSAETGIGAVASLLGVNRTSLATGFRQRFGVTMTEYRTLHRLAHVASGIPHGKGLAQLSAGAGFADQSHCTRLFRGYLGLPPAHWASAINK